MSLRGFGTRLARGINANADIIMSIIAIGGLVSTVALAIKATPKANDILDETKHKINRIKKIADEEKWTNEELDSEVRDVQLSCAKDLAIIYAPTAISLVGTTALIIGSNKINRSRNAAMAGALNATNIAFQEYKEHVKTSIGEKKFREIDESFEEKRSRDRPKLMETPNHEVYNTGHGNKLYSIDTIPGNINTRVFFRSSPEAVKQAELDFNSAMLFDGGENDGLYADYLWYLGIHDAIKYNGAMLTHHKMENAQDFVHARYHEYIHPTTNENWCHIDFYPTDWVFA